MLIVGYVIARRPPSRRGQPDQAAPQTDKKEPSWQRRLRQAHPLSVFLTGTILYSPSATYVGAVQQIATSDSGWAPALQLLVVIAIVLLTVEIPLLSYAIWPDATGRAVHRRRKLDPASPKGDRGDRVLRDRRVSARRRADRHPLSPAPARCAGRG